MTDKIESSWKRYEENEFRIEGQRYKDSDGEWLFLYEHPVAGWFGGVRESELDLLRQDFVRWLREQLFGMLSEALPRQEKLKKTAELLVDLLQQSPPAHDWLRLPADSRPQRNRSTVAYHSLLVSAFACAMVRAWLERGKPVNELLRFQTPQGLVERPLDEKELINFTRVAAICHDFGKQPPQRHNLRGREQVQQLFMDLMDPVVVFCLSEVAYRHHTGRSYRLGQESPIGFLEELIAHADTLASATDRPVSSDDPADPVKAVTRFFQEDLENEKVLSLISADTDRVKSYVFESARLPEVRGASALLTELNEHKIKTLLWKDFKLPSECLLYAAGGSALIVTPTSSAANITQHIQRLYLDETGTATISVVHCPISPHEWVKGVGTGEGNFGNLVKWLGYDLRRAKESRAFYPVFAALPYVRRCDSCEVRPAEQSEPEPDGGEIFLCMVCERKRAFGRNQKSTYLYRFEKEFLLTSEGSKTAYGKCLIQLSQTTTVDFAHDLHEVGSAAEGKAKGYIGVIYTDGNDIGSQLERHAIPAEFRTFSEELRHVTIQATFKALAKQVLIKEVRCSDGQKRFIHPFEIVAIGGDDVFLIVPGDVALDIALTLCEKFKQFFNQKLTMSAGVLIMHEHFPIYYAREIVEKLLKSAKKAGRKARGKDSHAVTPAYLDFQVITGDSNLGEDLEGYRDQFYSVAYSLSQIEHLTQRPYTLAELKCLLKTACWAKEKQFPASQLYQLRQAVVEQVLPWSQNWYHYQLARDKDNTSPGNFLNFHRQLFDKNPFEDREAPWRYRDGRWTTPTVDLVEIFNYVRRGKGGKTSETGD